jgi:SAM-dependent methyltransferase
MDNRYGGYDQHVFIAEYYDVAYNRRADTDVPFYVDYARQSKGFTLELACGTGRVLIPTARAGCEITGLDFSVYMLAKCGQKLDKEPEDVQKRVNLVQGNMTDFSLVKKYYLITIPFRPFQHLMTVPEQKACLNCVHRHLKPKGLLVFDVFNPNPAALVPSPERTTERQDFPEDELPDGRKVRRCSRFTSFHRDQQYNDIELIYYVTHPDGRKERLVDAFPMRYYFRYEIEHLLELCGFKVIDLFGGFDKSPFTSDSQEMIFVAGKK